jgi:hypothetical protein
MDSTTGKQTKTESTDKTNEELLALVKSRLKVARAFCKKPYEGFKKYIAEYELEDLDDAQEIRDKVRIGTIFRRTESDLPAIFDDQPDLFFKGKGSYRQYDNYFDNTYHWLWDIQHLEEVIDDAGALFDLVGMAFVSSPWETKTKKVTQPDQMTGQPMDYQVPVKDQPQAKTENPFKIFFSPETEFGVSLSSANCPYYFKEHSMAKEEIKSRFGKEVDPTDIMHTNITEVDDQLDEMKNDENTKDDIKRAKVYEYYGILPEEMAKGLEGGGWEYDKEYHLFFTSNEILLSEECQYPSYPLRILGNYGLITRFFKFGEAKHLMNLVREQEQYRTQILKHARKLANPKPMVPNMADVDESAFTDPNVGRMVKYQAGPNGEKPEYMQAPALGREVIEGLQMVKQDIEENSGSFNLAGGTGSSQVKTPRGIQVFSEASDRNTRRKRKKIARFIRELIIQQLKLCSQYLTPDDPRTQEILYGEEQPTVAPDDILATFGDDNILAKVDIEIESLSVNRVQMKQDSLDLLDLALKSEAQVPGLVNLQELWKDVLQNGYNKKDADRYLTSLEQIKAQAVQEFVAQAGQVNPQLGAAMSQLIQQPNMAQLQAGQPNPSFTPPNQSANQPPSQPPPASQGGGDLNG